ncbi:hypothetical protein QE450_004191 [Paenibacillus sp. SORGH_AS306]|nr:hypothetical protein [Paenibacillus sp. SORGH_AS_0306]MDR6109050.1 hypothetical protein [Paenibacillus sp. SORGH_AS_0338]
MKVTDSDTWDAIKKDEITGFSMWGIGKWKKIESEQEPVTKGLLNRIAKALGIIEKGTVTEKYNHNRKYREFWAAQDAPNLVLFRWSNWEGGMEYDPAIIREALQDFVDIAQGV